MAFFTVKTRSIFVVAVLLWVCGASAGDVPDVPTRSEAVALVAAEMEAKERDSDSRRAGLKEVEALEEWEINRGGRKIILRRVAAPAVAGELDASTVPAGDPGERLAGLLAAYPGRRMIHLRAYVYDRGFTELIWRDAGGREWRIFSNVDFNYLNGADGFIDGGYKWSAMIFLENIDSANEQARVLLAAANGMDYSPRTAPEAGLFLSAAPEYLVYAESEDSVPAALYEELDALHRHYRTNREVLIAGYERRKVLEEARREWRQANPPQTKDTVINFWRVR